MADKKPEIQQAKSEILKDRRADQSYLNKVSNAHQSAVERIHGEIDKFAKDNPSVAHLVDEKKTNAIKYLDDLYNNRYANNTSYFKAEQSKLNNYADGMIEELKTDVGRILLEQKKTKGSGPIEDSVNKTTKTVGERIEEPSRPKIVGGEAPLPDAPKEEALKNKTTVGKIGKQISDESVMDHVLRAGRGGGGRWKAIAGIGALAGLTTAANDKKDDGILSTVLKAGVGGGVALGVDYTAGLLTGNLATASDIAEADVKAVGKAEEGLPGLFSKKPKKNIWIGFQQDKEKMNGKKFTLNRNGNGKKLTVKGMEQKEIIKEHNTIVNLQKRERRIKSFGSKAGIASLVGLGVFALASAVDASDRMGNKVEESKMLQAEEQNLVRKQKQLRQDKAQYAYGHMDMGQMVLDAFNDRSGHHLMGNAKFQQPVYNTQYTQ